MSKSIVRLGGVALVLALVLAACGGEVREPGTPHTVAEVVDGSVAEQVVVRGYLFIDAARGAQLCDLIAESYPPQCGGARLTVIGQIPFLDDLTTDQGVSWSDGPVTLTGAWDGSTLTLP